MTVDDRGPEAAEGPRPGADHARRSIPTATGHDGGVDDPRIVEFFGPAYPAVEQFARMLAAEGVTRGLIGPREVPRLWERHLVNSATVAQYLPPEGVVVDVGSGAGLPGVVLAAMRPDLRVVLLEPMERRTVWLQEVVDTLGLPAIEVVRARADEVHGALTADAVTARAVAPMDRLAQWTLPLLRRGGQLLAMKGERGGEELEGARTVIASLGGGPGEVISARGPAGSAPTTIVRIVREHVPSPARPAGPRPVPTGSSGTGRGTARRVGRRR